MYPRQPYKAHTILDWRDIKDPVTTKKYDGANFNMVVQSDGSLKFYSRRMGVKGDYPERSDKLPHLTDKKLPELAGHVYTVELIHTGHNKENKENHPKVSGLLNSLPPKSIAEQKESGPIRAVLLDVVNPPLPTYRSKLLQMKSLQDKFGKPDVLFVPTPHLGKEGAIKLINQTKKEGHEGVIITSLDTPEYRNPRIKIKHQDTYNLRVSGIIQEVDIHGNLKPSMGALPLTDASGREVAKVGTGFSAAQRKEIWENPRDWIGKLIQVKSMGLAKQDGRLRMPIFNGDADGDIDLVV